MIWKTILMLILKQKTKSKVFSSNVYHRNNTFLKNPNSFLILELQTEFIKFTDVPWLRK